MESKRLGQRVHALFGSGKVGCAAHAASSPPRKELAPQHAPASACGARARSPPASEGDLCSPPHVRLRISFASSRAQYNEALDVAEQQMRLLKESYGVNHHEYATAMNNVATLYQAIGRHTDAEPLLLEASKIQQRTLGDDHPHTVASLSNLATVYGAMGQQARHGPWPCSRAPGRTAVREAAALPSPHA